MAWMAADDATLRGLWDAGIPTQRIAALMKRTKNAVIGRVHRLHLPARPSPIGASAADRRAVRGAVQREHPANALASLASVTAAKPAVVNGGGMGAVPARRVAIPQESTAPALSASARCQWPFWPDEGRVPRPPRFCDAPARLRRNEHGEAVACSYCPDHAARAYVESSRFYATPGQLRRMARESA